jgi:molybdopterin-guanine dinucleotide biosynthesis protein
MFDIGKDKDNYIRFDWAAKRLLRQKSNFVIIEGFLSTLLEEDIHIVKMLESESNKASEIDKIPSTVRAQGLQEARKILLHDRLNARRNKQINQLITGE